MSVTCEYISINTHKLKMQLLDTGAISISLSSKIRTKLGKPQLFGTIRHLEAYHGQQYKVLGSLTCDVEWNGCRNAKNQLRVVQFGKELELLGGDHLP